MSPTLKNISTLTPNQTRYDSQLGQRQTSTGSLTKTSINNQKLKPEPNVYEEERQQKEKISVLNRAVSKDVFD
jgi:hypothetical protein